MRATPLLPRKKGPDRRHNAKRGCQGGKLRRLNRTARPAKTLSPDTGLDRSGPPAQSSAFEQIKSNFLPKVTGAPVPRDWRVFSENRTGWILLPETPSALKVSTWMHNFDIQQTHSLPIRRPPYCLAEQDCIQKGERSSNCYVPLWPLVGNRYKSYALNRLNRS